MTIFVCTASGYVNLDQIQKLEGRSDGGYKIVSGNQVIDNNHKGIAGAVTSLIPVTAEWECLFADAQGDTAFEPVIAWGLDPFGSLVPVTPSQPAGAQGGYAIRKKGDPAVYARGQVFDSAQAWRAAQKQEPRPQIERLRRSA
ncbi:MAG: hypothetical protein GC131_02645 [Alphaproteobacteria bacterium]|nr:hypothetical protein [Alphaproteobacteria bacterium]